MALILFAFVFIINVCFRFSCVRTRVCTCLTFLNFFQYTEHTFYLNNNVVFGCQKIFTCTCEEFDTCWRVHACPCCCQSGALWMCFSCRGWKLEQYPCSIFLHGASAIQAPKNELFPWNGIRCQVHWYKVVVQVRAGNTIWFLQLYTHN